MNVSRRLFGPYLGARILTRNLHRTNSHRIADREIDPFSRKYLSQLRKEIRDSAGPKADWAGVVKELQEQVKLLNEQKNELQEQVKLLNEQKNEHQKQIKDQKTSPKKASFGGVLSYLDPRRYFLAMGPLSALLCNDPHWFVLLDDEKEKALHVRRKSFVSLAAKAALWDKEDMYRVYVLKAKG
jgi:hypothetical protein